LQHKRKQHAKEPQAQPAVKTISSNDKPLTTEKQGEIELTDEDLKRVAAGTTVSHGWNRVKN
jgi:hypothetical protein